MKIYLSFPRSTISQGFNGNANPLYAGQGLRGHTAIDWGVSWGTPVLNCVKDAYCYSVMHKDDPNPTRYRAVFTLVEDETGTYEVSYGHASAIFAEVGKTYQVGDVLMNVGNTGDVYSGGVAITKAARLAGSKAGAHLHGPQVRPVKKVTKTNSKKQYLSDGNGILKKNGFYYEVLDYGNGWNGCVNPEGFFVETLAKDANKPVSSGVFGPGTTSPKVTTFQTILRDTGFFPKTQAVTQYYGTVTAQSYEKFKASTGFILSPAGSSTGGEEVLLSDTMEQEQPPRFGFLKSNRFWAIVIGAVAAYARLKGFIGDAEITLIGTIAAGFVTVKTVDRIGDKKVEAAVLSQEG